MEEQVVELPDLPEPRAFRYESTSRHALGHLDGPDSVLVLKHDSFSPDEMRAYAREAVLAERERCAKLAEGLDYGSGLAALIRKG